MKPAAGAITGAASPAGYTFSHAQNDSFLAVNRLMKAGEDVSWIGSRIMYVTAKSTTRAILDKLAVDAGLSFTGVASQPSGDVVKLKPVRIGLIDTYGGSMPSGWMRFIFEQFEFPFTLVYAKELDAGSLASKYDVLVFPSGTAGGGGGRGGGGGGGAAPGGAAPAGDVGPDAGGFGQPAADRIPAEFQHMVGRFSADRTVPQIKKFGGRRRHGGRDWKRRRISACS